MAAITFLGGDESRTLIPKAEPLQAHHQWIIYFCRKGKPLNIQHVLAFQPTLFA